MSICKGYKFRFVKFAKKTFITQKYLLWLNITLKIITIMTYSEATVFLSFGSDWIYIYKFPYKNSESVYSIMLIRINLLRCNVFAATTLHTKIMKAWSKVLAKEYEDLRKRLLESSFSYLAGLTILLNRLCIAATETELARYQLLVMRDDQP
ncbi:hypothetical protein LSTR_LSTR012266 [Laodelphax striatellus]|uniref:Uncharacterized protein n=1 Tax=Laodelphax striatellus TaxID=195883 RepID=A0A482WK85_LAOST|nr:hypothetical protein LSTR_LSTR012266 [Laodelphax striatellus]